MKRKLLTGFIVIAFLIGLITPLFCSPATDSSYIKSVNLKKTGNKLEVTLLSSRPVEYKVTNMTDPYICLIVDISPALLTSDAKVLNNIICGAVKGVRIGQFSDNPDIVRLVIDLKSQAKYEISTIKEKPGITVSINYMEENVSKLASSPADNTDKTSLLNKKNNKAPEVKSTGKALNGKNENIDTAKNEKENYANISAAMLYKNMIKMLAAMKIKNSVNDIKKTGAKIYPEKTITIVKAPVLTDKEAYKENKGKLSAAKAAPKKSISTALSAFEANSKKIQNNSKTETNNIAAGALSGKKTKLVSRTAANPADDTVKPAQEKLVDKKEVALVAENKNTQTDKNIKQTQGEAKQNIPENEIIPVITKIKTINVFKQENKPQSADKNKKEVNEKNNTVKPNSAQTQTGINNDPKAVSSITPAKISTGLSITEPVKTKNIITDPINTESIIVKKEDSLFKKPGYINDKNTKKETVAYAQTNKTKKKDVKEPKEQTFDVEYDNEDIVFILNQLAKKTGKNIVTDSSVAGTVTISLKKATLDRALQVILKTAGFGYKKIDNIIVISKQENLAKISSVSIQKGLGSDTMVVIPINYASAEAVKKSVQDIIPDLDITIDKRLNAFVISASENEIKSVKSIVAQMDQLPSVSTDPNTVTRVINLKYAKAKEVQALISKWYPQVQPVLDERINGFIIKDNKANIEKVEKFITSVDAPKRQVQLDVKIIDLTESGSKALGVSWNSNASILSTTFTEVRNNFVPWQDVNNVNWPPLQLQTYQDIPFTGFGRSALSIPMTLNYLVSKGEAKILATPKVVTLSGEKAMIKVGQRYPITYPDPRAGITQAEYIDIAILLNVTPQITPDGYIMAEVAPEISDLATTTLGSQYPETITRSLKTNIIVKEGETIILGGLYRKDYTTSKNKIPLLGNMPFVGEMFKNTSDTSSKDEVVIMITPKLVEVGQ